MDAIKTRCKKKHTSDILFYLNDYLVCSDVRWKTQEIDSRDHSVHFHQVPRDLLQGEFDLDLS